LLACFLSQDLNCQWSIHPLAFSISYIDPSHCRRQREIFILQFDEKNSFVHLIDTSLLLWLFCELRRWCCCCCVRDSLGFGLQSSSSSSR
jgi:hypothetical protein